MVESEFINFCKSGKCLRNTIKSKKCSKEYKQKKCYIKYMTLIEKNREKFQKDEKWECVREEVFQRDNYKCQIWEILSSEERQYIKEVFGREYYFLCRELDPAHIIPRSQNKKLIYEKDNVVTISRYFHSLLDGLKHPVTQSPISKEERISWLKRALKNGEKNETSKIK